MNVLRAKKRIRTRPSLGGAASQGAAAQMCPGVFDDSRKEGSTYLRGTGRTQNGEALSPRMNEVTALLYNSPVKKR